MKNLEKISTTSDQQSYSNFPTYRINPQGTLDSLPKDLLLQIFKHIPDELPNIVLINRNISLLKYDILGIKTKYTYLFLQYIVVKTLVEETLSEYSINVFLPKVVKNIRQLWVSLKEGFILDEKPNHSRSAFNLCGRAFQNDKVTYEQIIEKVVKYIPHLECLHLQEFWVNNLYNHLSCLKKLKHLTLLNCEDPSKISVLKGVKLKGIPEPRTYLPSHLEPISFSQLQTLTIGDNPSLDETLPIFESATKLAQLSILFGGLMPKNFKQILSFNNLTILTLNRCGEYYNYSDILTLSTHSNLAQFNWTRVPFHPKPDWNRLDLPDSNSENNQTITDEFKRRNSKLEVKIKETKE